MSTGEWVLLSYRVPREPSTPRIGIWRSLKRLGVAQIGDGLVGLPADARTREQLEWVAEDVLAAGGSAGVWLARPGSAAQEREVAGQMAVARAGEYEKVIAQALAAAGLAGRERDAAVRRLRAELHRIWRRDFFPPPQRGAAVRTVRDLAAGALAPPVGGGVS